MVDFTKIERVESFGSIKPSTCHACHGCGAWAEDDGVGDFRQIDCASCEGSGSAKETCRGCRFCTKRPLRGDAVLLFNDGDLTPVECFVSNYRGDGVVDVCSDEVRPEGSLVAEMVSWDDGSSDNLHRHWEYPCASNGAKKMKHDVIRTTFAEVKIGDMIVRANNGNGCLMVVESVSDDDFDRQRIFVSGKIFESGEAARLNWRKSRLVVVCRPDASVDEG